jgi:hypothetical protein
MSKLKKNLEAALNYFPNEIDKKACLVTHKRLKIQDQSIIKSLASPHLWYWPPSRAFFLSPQWHSRNLHNVSDSQVQRISHYTFITKSRSHSSIRGARAGMVHKLIPQSAMHNATFLQYAAGDGAHSARRGNTRNRRMHIT